MNTCIVKKTFAILFLNRGGKLPLAMWLKQRAKMSEQKLETDQGSFQQITK